MVLLSGAMFSLVWTIIKAPEWGWGDSTTLGFIAAFAALIAAFVFWQSRAKQPLVPLSLFKNRSVSIGTVLMMMVGVRHVRRDVLPRASSSRACTA